MDDSIRGAIERALDYLERSQLSSGQLPMEFTVRENAPAAAGRAGTHPEESPFCTAYIAEILVGIDDARARRIAARALDFLESEKGRGGLWRYWNKSAPLHHQIPPDVDDTACISRALRIAGRPVPENAAIILSNRRSDGLFYTWITLRSRAVPSLSWWRVVLFDLTYGRLVGFWRAGARRDDVDSTVNANVVAYVGRRNETEDAIRWLRSVAAAGLEADTDKWYRSSPAFYYAISKCSESAPGDVLDFREFMTRSFGLNDGPTKLTSMNELQRAIAICALMRSDLRTDLAAPVVASLLATQSSDGSWPSFPIYFDGRDDPFISWGSRAVTTAFCLEALTRYSRNAPGAEWG